MVPGRSNNTPMDPLLFFGRPVPWDVEAPPLIHLKVSSKQRVLPKGPSHLPSDGASEKQIRVPGGVILTSKDPRFFLVNTPGIPGALRWQIQMAAALHDHP